MGACVGHGVGLLVGGEVMIQSVVASVLTVVTAGLMLWAVKANEVVVGITLLANSALVISVTLGAIGVKQWEVLPPAIFTNSASSAPLSFPYPTIAQLPSLVSVTTCP